MVDFGFFVDGFGLISFLFQLVFGFLLIFFGGGGGWVVLSCGGGWMVDRLSY